MTLTLQKTPIIEKTEELCETILTQDSYKDLQGKVAAFEQDPAAQEQYQDLIGLQEKLQAKQEGGEQLTQAEIDTFESKREAFFENPVARDFMDAQQNIHKVVETVTQYVAKTFQLGRVPTKDDFPQGSCGPSCKCSG